MYSHSIKHKYIYIMYLMFSSFNIQDIFSEFPEFLTLKRLDHKVHGHRLSQEIPDLSNLIFRLGLRGKILCSNVLPLYSNYFYRFPVVGYYFYYLDTFIFDLISLGL